MRAGHPSAQAGVGKGEFKAMLSYTVSMKKQKLEQSTAEHTCVTQWLRQGDQVFEARVQSGDSSSCKHMLAEAEQVFPLSACAAGLHLKCPVNLLRNTCTWWKIPSPT